MTKVVEIIEKLESYAPPYLACEWDNSGWQVNLGNEIAENVLICLSPTIDVVEQAVQKGCDLIISHHPVMFKKINKITPEHQTIIKAMRHNIQIYSAHTNLDASKGGVADVLADLLNVKNTVPIYEGLGRHGELNEELDLNSFLKILKEKLEADSLKIINQSNKKSIKTIALCPGGGSDLIPLLKDIDIFITADIKYHTAIETQNLILVDAGHFETERIILPVMKNILSDFDIKISIAQEQKPWQIF